MKKTYILFLLFILIAFNVSATDPSLIEGYACTDTPIIADNFTYSDSYDNHGWSYVGVCSPSSPVALQNYLPGLINNSLGTAGASVGGIPCFIDLRDTFTNVNSGSYIFAAKFGELNDSSGSVGNAKFTYAFTDAGSALKGQINIVENDDNTTHDFFGCTPTGFTFQQNTVYDIVFKMDLTNSVGSVYINNNSYGCDNIDISAIDNLGGLQIRHFHSANERSIRGTDNVEICQGDININTSTIVGEDFPVLFQDNFNYDTSMYAENDWRVFRGGDSINQSFTPIDNKLDLTQDLEFFAPLHIVQPFDYEFPLNNGVITQTVRTSPAYSIQFDLEVLEGGARFSIEDRGGDLVGILRARLEPDTGNLSWDYANATSPSLTYNTICGNCSRNDSVIKINVFFDNDNHPNCVYNFNSSVDDVINIYSDGVQLNGDIDFLVDRACNIDKVQIIKDIENRFLIDNYQLMAGTDPVIDTIPLYYQPLFDNVTTAVNVIIPNTGTGDFAESLNSLWQDFGLFSIASRLIFGMILLFFINIFVIGGMVSLGQQVNFPPLIIINVISMILFAYLRLIPAWVPFIIVVIGAGIGAFIIRNTVSD